MLRVAFAGTPAFAVPTLQALIDSPYQLVGVLTQPDRPAGRGRDLKRSPVKELALQASLPVAQPPSLKSPAERSALLSWAPDVLVVAAYGLILPPAALTIPRLGCINVHASLLPRWRGAAPIQRALLAGDTQTGVCIMQMAAGLDTGPVFAPVGRRELPLRGTETAGLLVERLAALGAQALIDTLAAVYTGTVSLEEQTSVGVTYAAKITKAEAQIDWQSSAVQIDRLVRAFNPAPVAYTLWEGQPLRIWEAAACPGAATPGELVAVQQDRLLVGCGEGLLSLSRVQLAGRRVVTAREFVGQRSLAGARLG